MFNSYADVSNEMYNCENEDFTGKMKRDKFSKGRNRKMRDHNLFTSALVPLNRSLFGMQGTA